MARNSNEAEVIRRAGKGDHEAFQTIYDKYRRRVYGLCLRMTANPADAEDLMQEAFVQLFRRIDTFRGESAFATWLYRLTFNVVLMSLRRKNLLTIPLDGSNGDGGDNEESRPLEFGCDDHGLMASVDRVALQRAMLRLPPGYRIIFVLHDIEGYEHNEIAEILDCSIGNCKSQLHKARLKLRQVLSGEKVRDRAPSRSSMERAVRVRRAVALRTAVAA